MKKLTYIAAYIVLMGIPSLILYFLFGKLINLKALLLLIFVSLFIGGIFDIWAVKQGKKDKFYIWEYSDKTTLGFKLLGVPIEDFMLFLILTPIYVVVAWETIKQILITNNLSSAAIILFGLLVLLVAYSVAYKLARLNNK